MEHKITHQRCPKLHSIQREIPIAIAIAELTRPVLVPAPQTVRGQQHQPPKKHQNESPHWLRQDVRPERHYGRHVHARENDLLSTEQISGWADRKSTRLNS